MKVQQIDDWNSFILRIQLCDWIFHCEDAVITNIEQNDELQKTIQLSFTSEEKLAIYKLHIYVEYFLPVYLDQHDVTFNIQLENMVKSKPGSLFAANNGNKVHPI